MTIDRFDNFPLNADKIQMRSTDRVSVMQSYNEAMKQCLHGDLWSFGVLLKLGNLLDRLSSLKSRDFIYEMWFPMISLWSMVSGMYV